MKKMMNYLAVRSGWSIALVVLLTGSALGLSRSSEGESVTTNRKAANTATVDARQKGGGSAEIDFAGNAVEPVNSPSNPVVLQVNKDPKDSTGRRPFQARIAVSPQGDGFQGAFLPIPAGKRLVIENVSAIARCPEGLRMEINFFTHYDNNGDGVGDSADITFHRIALTDQGVFGGTAIASANHKVLVFADEQIGTTHYFVVLQARLNGSTTGFTQAQVTFSGYVEDLPAVSQ